MLFRSDYIQGVQGAYKSDNNLIKDKDDPVVPPMPIGPAEGGAPAMNLFNLDEMRRQQMAPPAPASRAPVSNGGAVPNGGAVQSGGAVQNGGAVPNGAAVQTNPVPTNSPVTTAPGAQP